MCVARSSSLLRILCVEPFRFPFILCVIVCGQLQFSCTVTFSIIHLNWFMNVSKFIWSHMARCLICETVCMKDILLCKFI